MKKKRGFTLIEVIIVMSITLTLITITFSMFSQNTKISSELNIKSDLQSEVGSISSKISTLGMQSSGITKLILSDGTVAYDSAHASDEEIYKDMPLVDESGTVNSVDSSKNQWISINKIVINSKHERYINDQSSEVSDSPFTVTYNKYTQDNKNYGQLIINQELFDDDDKYLKNYDYIPSENVQSVLIKPSNLFILDNNGDAIKNSQGQLSKCTSIDIVVNLGKKRGINNLNYSMHTKVTFRNKGIGY